MCPPLDCRLWLLLQSAQPLELFQGVGIRHAADEVGDAEQPVVARRTGHRRLRHQPQQSPLARRDVRSEERTSELQSLLRIEYAVFCWKKKHKEATRNTKT